MPRATPPWDKSIGDGGYFTRPRLKKIYFRCCYRGTREMEILLARFARHHLAGLDKQQLEQFEALIGESDADLHCWLVRGEAAPKHINTCLIEALRQSHSDGHTP